jgi:hypothetical protein
MDECPSEFKDELKEFIDKVEGIVNSALNEMDIKCISDIGGIDTAFDIISGLADNLY